MAVFRIEKTRDYTVMSNHHLRNAGLSLKSKGLLSMMLSLPEDWNYTTRGLAKICKEGTDSIGSALKELERAGYIVRNRLRDSKGKIVDVEYVIYETPHPPVEVSRTGRDWMRERESYRELILENIEYDILVQNERMDRGRLDELVELMVDTVCPVCAVNMSECAGKAPKVEPEPEPKPEKESGSSGALVLILLLAALGGGAFAYIKFIKPKQGAKVSADPDDYEFEDEEYENEDN